MINKNLRKIFRFKFTITYIICVFLINAIVSYIPYTHLWGEVFSLGDVTVGAIYVFRDLAQREIKHYVIIAMIIGGILSYIFAEPSVAIASVTAFMAGEVIDFAIYTYTKKPLSQRIIWSSLISCPIDSVIFLKMTNQLNYVGLAVMLLAKFVGVMVIWYLWRVRCNTPHYRPG